MCYFFIVFLFFPNVQYYALFCVFLSMPLFLAYSVSSFLYNLFLLPAFSFHVLVLFLQITASVNLSFLVLISPTPHLALSHHPRCVYLEVKTPYVFTFIQTAENLADLTFTFSSLRFCLSTLFRRSSFLTFKKQFCRMDAVFLIF